MPRIPYVLPAPGESAIADGIRLRRPNRELTVLDGILLNAPDIAAGYNQLLKSIRTENSLPADIRELMILRVAALNRAAYEWIQHEPLARAAGMTSDQLRVVRDLTRIPAEPTENLEVENKKHLSPAQAAALVYTDYMTRFVKVPQDAFNRLRGHLENDQQMFEATATIASYNMVSRLLVALDVADKAEEEVPLPEGE